MKINVLELMDDLAHAGLHLGLVKEHITSVLISLGDFDCIALKPWVGSFESVIMMGVLAWFVDVLTCEGS